MSEAPEKRTNKIWRSVFIGLAVLLVLYPVSIGPLAGLAIRIDGGSAGGPVDNFFTPLYQPVWWAAEAVGCEKPLMNYIGLCVRAIN